MVDDGRGAQVHIPTVLIGYEDGLKMLETIREDSVVVALGF